MEEKKYKLKFIQRVFGVFKAIMDFIIAIVALLILSPIFIVVAIAIKIDSKGPVFFTQKRIGRRGKTFNCVKFRSMAVDAKPDVAGYEYEEVNNYITKVGKFIRKLSIDELPQLFNVLTFKMSLIGYRPSQPCENELNDAREEYGMYQIRPGISGWAQINGRDVLAAHPKKKALYDAYYLHHFSLWLDIKIFFLTIIRVFKHDDVSEGVVDENATALHDGACEEIAVNEVTSENTVAEQEGQGQTLLGDIEEHEKVDELVLQSVSNQREMEEDFKD